MACLTRTRPFCELRVCFQSGFALHICVPLLMVCHVQSVFAYGYTYCLLTALAWDPRAHQLIQRSVVFINA